VSELSNSADNSRQPESRASTFSREARALLAATVCTYVESGGAPDQLSRVTTQLCQEAQAKGLSADEALTEIRAALDTLLATCAITSSDRAALVALAIGDCVHAFYNGTGMGERASDSLSSGR
jgi:hypothetical protein